ncbi:hypothetical protein CRE_27731 [Caenorhabditis remanei]|uniref:F-box domain-containing protein n=1 Tax=Caenorhabditis remanei TaxID=31234 RepID=E3MXM8_CAERE|nr:hypothetical protein CRE_27731 [Caenorhabditis remanei]
MSSPFPLLRLPRLVLLDVFKSLSIGEKINLSLCSKKIFTLINNGRLYSKKVIVDLDMTFLNIEVHSENKKDRIQIFNCSGMVINNDWDIQQHRFEGHNVPVDPSERKTKINN